MRRTALDQPNTPPLFHHIHQAIASPSHPVYNLEILDGDTSGKGGSKAHSALALPAPDEHSDEKALKAWAMVGRYNAADGMLSALNTFRNESAAR